MAREPELVNPGLPTGPISMSGDSSVPGYTGHLYSDATGMYRARFGTWEQHVLSVERERPGFIAWYRNPSGGQRALRIPYEATSGYAKLYPDFVFIHADEDGMPQASIIDPHGHHLADAGDKLRGLAKYAHDHGAEVARVIGVIRSGGGEFRLLDLKDETIRAALTGVNGKDAIEEVFAQHGAVYG